jgi:hypothetical protein
VERTNVPKVYLYPAADQVYTFVYYRIRRIQDAGNYENTSDVNFRFLPCLVAGLAYYLSMKVPGGLERMPALKAQFDEAIMMAEFEDREKAPVRLTPRVQR